MKDLPDRRSKGISKDLIDSNELSGEQIGKVLKNSVAKGFARAIPGIRELYSVVDTVNQEIREEKMGNVLRDFQSHFQSIDQAMSQLKTLLSNRAGIIIFQKVVQIIDNGSMDEEWLFLMSKVLKWVSDPDFERQFEGRTYALSQIARLSPQALIILSKYRVWQQVNIQGTTTMSGQTAGDWEGQVTRFLKAKIGIEDGYIGIRINHSFKELDSAGMVRLEGHQLKLSAIGLEIHQMLE